MNTIVAVTAKPNRVKGMRYTAYAMRLRESVEKTYLNGWIRVWSVPMRSVHMLFNWMRYSIILSTITEFMLN